jgi:1-acyl-sn-glycerol-3-phosphate acyltransferase
MVGQWWDNGGTMVGQWWDNGGTMVGQWLDTAVVHGNHVIHLKYFDMLHFIIVHVWSWMIVPFVFSILRPFVHLDSQANCRHFLCTVLGVQHQISGETLLDKGFILANHRGHFDVMYDAYVSNSVMMGRRMMMLAIPFVYLLSYIDDRVILIHRGKDHRADIFQRCIGHISRHPNKRILFYPEGTRNAYTTLHSCEELRSYIRIGLLKEIYKAQCCPVQLLISNNKEQPYNEKKLTVNYGVKINTKVSKPIHPKDYATDTEFIDEIVRTWFDCYIETHSHVQTQ